MPYRPEEGLALLETLRRAGQLGDYQPLHAAQADLLWRAGRVDEARAAYARALALAGNDVEGRSIGKRLEGLGPPATHKASG